MKTMRKILTTLLLLLAVHANATADYTREDSVKVMRLLEEGQKQHRKVNFILFYARKLVGIPYIAQTLEVNSRERLVVNLRQLDCTTYVENVLALTLCTQNRKTTFADFCNYLRLIRYEGGKIDYTSRLHYFTDWIADNTRLGFVHEIQRSGAPFTQVQTVRVGYMTRHAADYPMLKAHPERLKTIAESERKLTGKQFRYIPKVQITNSRLCRNTIKDGDIIAIITAKKGLDTSHIGIAVWHKDGLHLLNASQVRRRVVEEPMLLRTYMVKHPMQTGIRIVRVGKKSTRQP